MKKVVTTILVFAMAFGLFGSTNATAEESKTVDERTVINTVSSTSIEQLLKYLSEKFTDGNDWKEVSIDADNNDTFAFESHNSDGKRYCVSGRLTDDGEIETLTFSHEVHQNITDSEFMALTIKQLKDYKNLPYKMLLFAADFMGDIYVISYLSDLTVSNIDDEWSLASAALKARTNPQVFGDWEYKTGLKTIDEKPYFYIEAQKNIHDNSLKELTNSTDEPIIGLYPLAEYEIFEGFFYGKDLDVSFDDQESYFLLENKNDSVIATFHLSFHSTLDANFTVSGPLTEEEKDGDLTKYILTIENCDGEGLDKKEGDTITVYYSENPPKGVPLDSGETISWYTNMGNFFFNKK